MCKTATQLRNVLKSSHSGAFQSRRRPLHQDFPVATRLPPLPAVPPPLSLRTCPAHRAQTLDHKLGFAKLLSFVQTVPQVSLHCQEASRMVLINTYWVTARSPGGRKGGKTEFLPLHHMFIDYILLISTPSLHTLKKKKKRALKTLALSCFKTNLLNSERLRRRTQGKDKHLAHKNAATE